MTKLLELQVESRTVVLERVTRLQDADYAVCRVDGCMIASKHDPVPWSLSGTRYMHETGIGREDTRHRVDYYRLAEVR